MRTPKLLKSASLLSTSPLAPPVTGKLVVWRPPRCNSRTKVAAPSCDVNSSTGYVLRCRISTGSAIQVGEGSGSECKRFVSSVESARRLQRRSHSGSVAVQLGLPEAWSPVCRWALSKHVPERHCKPQELSAPDVSLHLANARINTHRKTKDGRACELKVHATWHHEELRRQGQPSRFSASTWLVLPGLACVLCRRLPPLWTVTAALELAGFCVL